MQEDKNINSYSCSSCGINFEYQNSYIRHMRKHMGKHPHHCTLCGKTFLCKSGLDSHASTHTGIRPHQCTFCDKTFRRTGDLKAHIRIHTGEKKYKCDICGKAFIHHGTLKNHVLGHLDLRPYACSQCGKKFRCLGHVKVHERTHTGERPYHCDACGATFTRNGHLTCHKKSSCKGKFVSNDKSRKRTSKRNAKNPMVDADTIIMSKNNESSDIQSLASNEKKLANMITVPIADEKLPQSAVTLSLADVSGQANISKPNCGKSDKRIKIDGSVVEKMRQTTCNARNFIYNKNLTDKLEMLHQKIHVNRKTFSCDSCKIIYKCSRNYIRHMRKHTGERPYQCTLCEKTFICKAGLDSHTMTHTASRPHQCTFCGKTFRQTGALYEHIRIHTGEKRYQCDVCGKAFTHNATLKNHVLCHLDSRPYVCKQCGQKFRSSGNLKAHKRRHTGERPYQCDVCGTMFTRSNHLSRHKKFNCKDKFCSNGKSEKRSSKRNEKDSVMDAEAIISHSEDLSTIYTDGLPGCEVSTEVIVCTEQIEIPVDNNDVYALSPCRSTTVNNRIEISTGDNSQLCVLGDFPFLVQTEIKNSKDEFGLTREVCSHLEKSDGEDNVVDIGDSSICDVEILATDHRADSQSEALSNCIPHGIHSSVTETNNEMSENCENSDTRFVSDHAAKSHSEAQSNSILHVDNSNVSEVSENCDNLRTRLISADSIAIASEKVSENTDANASKVIIQDLESKNYLYASAPVQIIDSICKGISQTVVILEDLTENLHKTLLLSNSSDGENVYKTSAVCDSLVKDSHIVEKMKQTKCNANARNLKCNKNLTDKPETSVQKINVGKKTFACDTCKIVYKCRTKYIRHMRKHTGERPYQCTLCGKTFICKTGLDSHTMTHTGSRPHRCSFCGKTFRQTGAMYEHIRIHTGEKRYQCDMCGKAFTHNATLKHHVLSHLDSRPFVCEQCGQKFRSSRDCKVHERKHTGERPYQCDACGTTFTRSSHLSRHKKFNCKGKFYSNNNTGMGTSKENTKI